MLQPTRVRPGLVTTRTRRSCGVITLPLFERYGDQILEWLAAIDEAEPARQNVMRVVKSMRCTIERTERVRNSVRHSNLASFVRHAARALEASEWDGARYILVTAMALMNARTASAPSFRECFEVRQFPLPAGSAAALPPDAAMGIVTG